jgi:hypothetical protein
MIDDVGNPDPDLKPNTGMDLLCNLSSPGNVCV